MLVVLKKLLVFYPFIVEYILLLHLFFQNHDNDKSVPLYVLLMPHSLHTQIFEMRRKVIHLIASPKNHYDILLMISLSICQKLIKCCTILSSDYAWKRWGLACAKKHGYISILPKHNDFSKLEKSNFVTFQNCDGGKL